MENLQNIVESLFLWEWKQKHAINISQIFCEFSVKFRQLYNKMTNLYLAIFGKSSCQKVVKLHL